MIIWDWIKEKKIIDISLKKRKEGNVVVVYGKNLEICYLNKIGGGILYLSADNITIKEIRECGSSFGCHRNILFDLEEHNSISAGEMKVTIKEISSKLLSKYDVDEKVLHDDLIEIIRDLQWKRIIKLEG